MIRETLARLWAHRTLTILACFPLSLVCSVGVPVALWVLMGIGAPREAVSDVTSAPPLGAVLLFYAFLLSVAPAEGTYLVVCGMTGGPCELDWTTIDLPWGLSLGTQILMWYIVTCTVVLFLRHVMGQRRGPAEKVAVGRELPGRTVELPVLVAASLPLSLLCSVLAPVGLAMTILASSALHGQGGGLWALPVEPDQLPLVALFLVFAWPGGLAWWGVATLWISSQGPSAATLGLDGMWCLPCGVQLLVWFLITCGVMWLLARCLRGFGARERTEAS